MPGCINSVTLFKKMEITLVPIPLNIVSFHQFLMVSSLLFSLVLPQCLEPAGTLSDFSVKKNKTLRPGICKGKPDSCAKEQGRDRV